MVATLPKPRPPSTSCRVAVVGAGAAGLVAARELRREGHLVVVYERENQVGGTWVYMPETESDPLGCDPAKEVPRPQGGTSVPEGLRKGVCDRRDG